MIAAIEWPLADVIGEPPTSEIIASRQVEGQFSETLHITNDAVWFRVSRRTARVTGTTWMALPSLLSDADLAELQQTAGLASSPLLRTGAEWKQALIESGPVPPPAR
jgi:hypothetical protein